MRPLPPRHQRENPLGLRQKKVQIRNRVAAPHDAQAPHVRPDPDHRLAHDLPDDPPRPAVVEPFQIVGGGVHVFPLLFEALGALYKA